jgi:cobalt-zinc-cadmium efflux system protein
MSGHVHHKRKTSLNMAFWLNAIFSVIEIAGAFYTHSTAIFTDAIHDLGDSLAIGLGIFFEKIAEKKPDAKYTYGYQRFSLLSALILSVILIIGAVIMVSKAIGVLMQPHEVNSEGMFGLAILGITVNGFAFFKIRGNEGHNHNSKAIMLHFLEDVLGWVAVLLGSIIMYYTHWFWIDGALSICIALFIGYNAVRNIMETMLVLLQAAPDEVNIHQLKDELSQVEGVKNIVHLHVWSLDESTIVGTVHVLVEDHYGVRSQKILSDLTRILEARGIRYPTTQIVVRRA